MALKQGKKQVGLQSGNISASPFPTTTITAQIAKPISEIITSFQKTAEADAKVSWQYDFDQKTRDHYLQLKQKFEFDPEGMKNAVDTYSKTILKNTPSAFKSIAQNVLAGKNLHNLSHASTNYRKKQTRDAFNGWELKKIMHEENFNNELDNLSNDEYAAPINFNNYIDEKFFLDLNHDYGLSQESLVDTGRMAQSNLITDLDKQIKNVELLRVFNIMKNIGEVDAIKYLTEYSNGKDIFKIKSKNPNNPRFKKDEKYLKDPIERGENVNKIKSLYQQHISKNILENSKKKTKLNFDKLSEINQPLDVANFKGGSVDPNDIAENLNVDIGSSDHDKIINIVNKLNNIQRVVAKTMQNPNEQINWDDEGVTAEDWATALLANQTPSIRKIKYNDLTSDGFITAVNKMAEQDYFPSELDNALAVNPGMNYKDESSLNKLADQSKIYQYVKNLFPDIDYPGIYEQAINAGVIDEIDNGNFKTATDILSNFNNDDYIERLESISSNENNTLNFRQLVNKKVASPNFVKKMIAGGSDELNKNLFSNADQTTIFAVVPSNIMSPVAYDQLQSFFNESIANMTSGKKINVWNKSNTKLVDQAWNIASRKLKQSGYGIENNTFDGQPRLVKEPYAATYGEPNNNDIYSHIKKAFMTGDNIEDNFGTKDWNNINKDLSKYFDNKNNENIKISIDRQTYNDENGKAAYKLTMWNGDFAIPIEGNFKPAGWTDYNKATIPGPVAGNMNTVVNDTVNKIYEEIGNKVSFNNKDYERSDFGKRALYSVIRNGIKLSDYRFYPDIPGLDDQPKEVRPFAFVARMMGFKGDLREIQNELSTAAEIANNNLSEQKKINLNRNLSDLEKITSATVPPEKMVMSENAMSTNFKDYALKNYQNTELRLTHRTNNWGAVSSNNWDGEIDVKYKKDGRNFAVFTHPKNSIRAATKSILNHSMLTAKLSKVDKRYGIEPTIREILTMYAEDTDSYLNALVMRTNFLPSDTINLMDANQMHQLLKFITQHEMGFAYFNEKFGNKNPYVNSVIFKGIDEAINSYNGELGKL